MKFRFWILIQALYQCKFEIELAEHWRNVFVAVLRQIGFALQSVLCWHCHLFAAQPEFLNDEEDMALIEGHKTISEYEHAFYLKPFLLAAKKHFASCKDCQKKWQKAKQVFALAGSERKLGFVLKGK